MKIAKFPSLLHTSTSFDGIVRLLAIKVPIGIREITVILQKIATNTFLDAGCLMSIVYLFLFGLKSIHLVSGQGRSRAGKGGQNFSTGAIPPKSPG